MDNLEKKIIENRSLFDDKKVDKDALWDKIEGQLPKVDRPVKNLTRFKQLSIAASVIAILGMSLFFATMYNSTNSSPSDQVAQALSEIDMHYKGLVSLEVTRLKNHEELSEDEKHEFLFFLDELDEEYDFLRKEMEKNIDNELILEAIVANYKKRIELIENLLKQINNSKLKDEDYGYTL